MSNKGSRVAILPGSLYARNAQVVRGDIKKQISYRDHVEIWCWGNIGRSSIWTNMHRYTNTELNYIHFTYGIVQRNEITG